MVIRSDLIKSITLLGRTGTENGRLEVKDINRQKSEMENSILFK
jgi:hypothetical protein